MTTNTETIGYFCRECGNEVETTDTVAFCPDHPNEVVDSVLLNGDLNDSLAMEIY